MLADNGDQLPDSGLIRGPIERWVDWWADPTIDYWTGEPTERSNDGSIGGQIR
jgi:hypothetical protein